jgi:hypothetical protein
MKGTGVKSGMFLLSLITKLQKIGTAPAIDMMAYAAWLRS